MFFAFDSLENLGVEGQCLTDFGVLIDRYDVVSFEGVPWCVLATLPLPERKYLISGRRGGRLN